MYTFIIGFFLLSISVSFLCSIWEAVLLSITPAYAAVKEQENSDVGHALQQFKADIDRPLAALLTLNTIAHTVGAIGVGAQASAIWGVSIVSTLIVPAVMTLAILLLSEIIPKTIGANYWQELTPFTVKSLKLIIKLLIPFVWLSQLITRMLKRDKGSSSLSRAEFTAMADLGNEQGIIDQNESNLMKNILRYEAIRVTDVMTPRTVVVAAEVSTTVKEFHQRHRDLRFSRIPVFEESIDQITGYVLKDQILASLVDMLENRPDKSAATLTMGELRRTIMMVPASQAITQLFNDFIEQREHIALVVDDYGGMAGIVTMEDVIETLLGLEIVDELDQTIDMQALARHKWESRARNMGLDISSADTELPDSAAESAKKTSE